MAKHDVAGLTTTQVSEQIVKVLTKAAKCSFVELIQQQAATAGTSSEEDVGKASIFTSHAWSYIFTDVVDTLRDLAKKRDLEVAKSKSKKSKTRIFFWFDIFVVNQHKAPNLPFEWWRTTFRSNIERIGEVVVVMAPWDNPTPLTRAWCLWEIYSAIQLKDRVKMSVALPPNQRQAFLEGIMESIDAILDAIMGMDARKSKVSVMCVS